ncbi:UDP-phosphate galactose phosphotransferase [Rodentibacter rarus]|uniref:UDP-phosphate galactose phosphotransferase n=1 Tax=Rodentibacter rarus TaxID=1908260 RepID=A0A1V3IM56_9PAST|nr:undecaprenyl-phosphate galactose phosphotransferase WbaP [Rodentibacter rarus]OOF42944.1 UDP-phosphate galactose phosphotransferase [Rodentibacter rarus]OOF42979.1 UDP-phosphate galactose phosphotransferase [Rodentibacter rarus]
MNKVMLIKLLQITVDFVTCFFSLFFSLSFLLLFRENISDYFPDEELDNAILIHFSISILCVIWFWTRLRHYTYRKPFWFELKEILRTLFIFLIIELSIIALSKLYVSRHFWVMTWIFVFIMVPLGRIILKMLLIKSKIYLKDTVIIGNGKNAKDVLEALNQERYLGFNVRLFVSTEYKKYCKEKLGNIPVISKNPELLIKLFKPSSTQFIIAMDDNDTYSLDYWLRFFMKKRCRSVSIIPSLRGIPLYSTNMAFLFSHEMVLFRVNNNLAKFTSRIIKRIFDIIISLFCLILLSPLFLTIIYLIRKDGGEAIYAHPRIGQNKQAFKCLKFRSMVINSDEVLEDYLRSNPEAKKEWEKDFKLKEDPRITKIGAFLRKTSLDELPQLWNVLKGEMSLVGPRPIVQEELKFYQDDIDYYLMVKPGMTGLWQVSGRSNVNYERRVYFDTWYIKNWSLWNDIVILVKTVDIVLRQKGAY